MAVISLMSLLYRLRATHTHILTHVLCRCSSFALPAPTDTHTLTLTAQGVEGETQSCGFVSNPTELPPLVGHCMIPM